MGIATSAAYGPTACLRPETLTKLKHCSSSLSSSLGATVPDGGAYIHAGQPLKQQIVIWVVQWIYVWTDIGMCFIVSRTNIACSQYRCSQLLACDNAVHCKAAGHATAAVGRLRHPDNICSSTDLSHMQNSQALLADEVRQNSSKLV